jgi:hypothetical protein
MGIKPNHDSPLASVWHSGLQFAENRDDGHKLALVIFLSFAFPLTSA